MTKESIQTQIAQPERGISAFTLKMIAIISMLINHIGHTGLIENHYFYMFAMIIGKLTFPIMAFLMADGFKYTSNLKKYILRMGLFSIISGVPFKLGIGWGFLTGLVDTESFGSIVFSVLRLMVNNIFFTLMVGLIVLYLCTKIQNRFLRILMIIAGAALTMYSDWPIIGVFMIVGFARIQNRTARILIPTLIITVVLMLLFIAGSLSAPSGEIPGAEAGINWDLIIEAAGMVLVIPFLFAYHGKRGPHGKVVRWSFYAFYPLHLTILAILRWIFQYAQMNGDLIHGFFQ